MSQSRLKSEVRVVGTGLLGSSIGLGLTAKGVTVQLDDISPSSLRLAIDYGAGVAATPNDDPALIVVCVPPDVTARVVAEQLRMFPNAIVTDVASVKAAPLQELHELGADVSRYLGTHPMAGRERSGALAGRGDLFIGRPWVIAGHDDITYSQGGLVEDLILDLGAMPIEMNAADHDRAVAVASHVPQLVSSLMAARLETADDEALRLAGQGLRDVTRIAASDTNLWVQILGANSVSVAEELTKVRSDLDALITALTDIDRAGARRVVADALHAGNAGVERLPGKHGQKVRFARISVRVDDKPGQLARLMTTIDEIGINIEDFRIEHAEGAAFGVAEVLVQPERATDLVNALSEREWTVLL
ncbi:prephenate dehydrogenase [Humidisolicoccus flavus]|uniref:prephenate dehydrogenase n=1 Tax=Humidisolicoccus flavus TaxID=3111414 RepID=UPI003254500D